MSNHKSKRLPSIKGRMFINLKGINHVPTNNFFTFFHVSKIKLFLIYMFLKLVSTNYLYLFNYFFCMFSFYTVWIIGTLREQNKNTVTYLTHNYR